MEKFRALRTAVRIVETLSQLPGAHTLPVRCDSAAEAALLVSFVRGTAGERFCCTGNGKFVGFEASGDPVYTNTETVYIRSCAVRRLCGHCETYNGPHSTECEVCDRPL